MERDHLQVQTAVQVDRRDDVLECRHNAVNRGDVLLEGAGVAGTTDSGDEEPAIALVGLAVGGTGTAVATEQAVQSEWVAARMGRQVRDQREQDWADRGGKGLMCTRSRAQHCSAGVVGAVADTVVAGSAGTVGLRRVRGGTDADLARLESEGHGDSQETRDSAIGTVHGVDGVRTNWQHYTYFSLPHAAPPLSQDIDA